MVFHNSYTITFTFYVIGSKSGNVVTATIKT